MRGIGLLEAFVVIIIIIAATIASTASGFGQGQQPGAGEEDCEGPGRRLGMPPPLPPPLLLQPPGEEENECNGRRAAQSISQGEIVVNFVF